MATRPAATVGGALVRKGMVSDKRKTHVVYKKKLDGVTTVATHISHGCKEIGDSLGGRMAEQCRIGIADFWRLIDCPMTEKEWNEAILKWVADQPKH